MISFHGVKKAFGDRTVLDGVSFDVRPGEVFFIIGASGAGKSVLIKQLVGLMAPDAGQIWLDGEDLTRKTEREFFEVRKRCAMVFQHSTLFDSMSCVDNVALPLQKHGGLSEEDSRMAALELLDQVQMRQYAARLPAELGDGMKKRVAIARALGFQPRYVLFDEPTTGLDPLSARRVDRLITDLSRRLGVTSVVVSHDLRSIFGIADRIAMLYKGKVRLLGAPSDFLNAEDPVIRQFVGGLAEGPIE